MFADLMCEGMHLVQRGGSFNPKLLAGTVYAGLDLWFADKALSTRCGRWVWPVASPRRAAAHTIDAEPGDGNRGAHCPRPSGWNRER